MIPKKIHYFWFGKNPKSKDIQKCIESFAEFAPGFEIKEWNEENFDVDAHSYTRKAYVDKKWAFVSDYARLKVLLDEGGVYLDTDMLLLRDISELCELSAFVGKEDDKYISAGILGVPAKHPFVRDTLLEYEKNEARIPIPVLLTKIFEKGNYDIKVFEKDYFYAFDAEHIHLFNGHNAPREAYAVHLWNYSWGSPVVKFAKKIGVYKPIVKTAERLQIKKVLKKALRME